MNDGIYPAISKRVLESRPCGVSLYAVLRALFRRFSNVTSWQSPVVAPLLRALDPIDYAIRVSRSRLRLPPYSLRVRSVGVHRQLGGASFAQFGNLMARYLTQFAGVTGNSRVLEIGCGVGRIALPLADTITDGRFVGVDIDRTSIAYCRRQKAFARPSFAFETIDVRNAIYNPAGRHRADEYRFPFGDGSFDTVYLVSVFTHMVTRDVQHYVGEIARMLAPGGVCMASMFLVDQGLEARFWTFQPTDEPHFVAYPERPEIATGYHYDFVTTLFARHGMEPLRAPVRGRRRKRRRGGFGQDLVFFRKTGPRGTAG